MVLVINIKQWYLQTHFIRTKSLSENRNILRTIWGPNCPQNKNLGPPIKFRRSYKTNIVYYKTEDTKLMVQGLYGRALLLSGLYESESDRFVLNFYLWGWNIFNFNQLEAQSTLLETYFFYKERIQ